MALLFASLPLAGWFGVLVDGGPAGVGDGEPELVCATMTVQKARSAHTRQKRCFLVIDYLSVSQRSARSRF